VLSVTSLPCIWGTMSFAITTDAIWQHRSVALRPVSVTAGILRLRRFAFGRIHLGVLTEQFGSRLCCEK
jgi:hypothetical protein